MRFYTSAIIVIISLGFAIYPAGEIRGKVCIRKPNTRECNGPLDSVRVCCFVKGETDSIICYTDSLGQYRILIDEAPGRKTLIFSRPGFVTATVQDVIVSENKTTYLFEVDLEASR